MKMLEVKTVRFAAVVEKCGSPEVFTLWQKPESDRHFQSLLKNHRLMTVQQSNTGTDFGIAEYCKRKGATYLAFAKSLKPFENRRVVGVNWELVKK